MSEIIVGVDGSSRGEDAIAFARRVAAVSGATIRLLSAFPYEGRPPTNGESREYRAQLEADATEMLERMRGLAGDKPVSTCAVADFSPAQALHELADRDRAALIVVGSSHRGGPAADARAGRSADGPATQPTLDP